MDHKTNQKWPRTRGNPTRRTTKAPRSELVAAIDHEGKPLESPVLRSDAHRHGIWHRSVSVFVLNQYGELLIERRSETKDLFPGYYDILGGHVQPGQAPLDTAVQEIGEELSISVRPSRLERLSPEDGVLERVVLPEQAIVNLERKTVYLLELDPTEEKQVLALGASVSRLTPEELEERGPSGEVSQIEFWTWERLHEMATSSRYRPLASGTLSAMSDDATRERVSRACLALRAARRKEFAIRYAFSKEGEPSAGAFDQRLFDVFLERPAVPAPRESVATVFDLGVDQLAGAYQLGPFRQVVAGDDYWGPKLRDPETRYVHNLLAALAYGQEPGIQQKLDQVASGVQTFVGELLNLPLANGVRFRDNLGNLADIAVARKATLFGLENASSTLQKAEIRDYPTGSVTKICLQAGCDLLDRPAPSSARTGFDRFRELVLIGIGASAADFNSPAFQEHAKAHMPGPRQIALFLAQSAVRELDPRLGGDRFLADFYETVVASQRRVNIAYLAGNAAQACASMTIAQEILRTNPRATVRFVAKSGSPGNDLTAEDARELIAKNEVRRFSDLARFREDGRFSLVLDGPQCHGLDPGRLSAGFAQVLAEADVILAEGQAYAEIRGWKKPTYIAFRVNGRVAEAIHGVSRGSGASGFVRLTPGVDHFEDFQMATRRTVSDPTTPSRRIPAAAQTTIEYVRAILGENLDLIVRCLFHGSYPDAYQRLTAEAHRLGKTFAQVLTGAASERPDDEAVARAISSVRFPVFACGGGGGFNSVTLRALRMLGLPTVAGVPATDDGGSTGELQRWLREERGFVFGVGDMAAILQDALLDRGKRALLSYRFDTEPESLTRAVMERIVAEVLHPAQPDALLGAADDFLSFACGQLNLARVIDERFRVGVRAARLPIKGASIRNLNVIAAYELCGMLGDRTNVADQSRLAAFYVLQKALGVPADLLVLPVTYSESVLYLEYENPVSPQLAEAFHVPDTALSSDRRRMFGQNYVDQLPQPGARVTVGVVEGPLRNQRPLPNPEYLTRLREAELFVMGAGSLVGSQLAQLAVPGVVDVLLKRSDMRRILVLNHVKMNETLGMSLRDQVRLIETVATENASPAVLEEYGGSRRSLRISDLFTDVVVPRTIARELEAEMLDAPVVGSNTDGNPTFVELSRPGTSEVTKVFCNRYVKFLIDNPTIRDQYDVTNREIEILSYLDQPPTLYSRRSEGGRYRGALFATREDITYLARQGIQLRSIHEVDSIGENWKFVKVEGTPTLEFFPGLVPEALVGIFRIAIERGARARKSSDPTRPSGRGA